MRYIFTAIILILSVVSDSAACVQIPSIWKPISRSSTTTEALSVYSLNDIFIKLHDKANRELRASRIPIKPLVFRVMVDGKSNLLISEKDYQIVKESASLVFNDCEFLGYKEMTGFFNNGSIDNTPYKEKYYVDLVISDPVITNISFIDLNPRVWALVKHLRRDEVKVFARISNPKDDVAVFLDEFEVSPTLAIETALTPNGCFMTKFEKNNFDPIVVDWGSEDGESEHEIRLTHAYVEIPNIPPIGDFASDISIKVDYAMKNAEICQQVTDAVKKSDAELLEIVLETYPNFNVNTLDSQGRAPIHYAVSTNSLELIKSLLKRKADVNLLSYDDNTALHEALLTSKTSKDMIDLLMNSGADLTIKNKTGKTPADIAKERNISLNSSN